MKPNKIIAGIVTILMIFATAQTTAAQTQRYGGGRFGNRENSSNSSDNRGNATVQPQSRTQTQNQNNNAATRTQQPAQQTPRNAAPQQQQRGFAPQQGQPSNPAPRSSSSHISFGREPQRGTEPRREAPRYQENEPRPDHFAPRPMGPRPVYHRNIDRHARAFYIDNSPYYFADGAYYRYVPNYGYEEIAVPTDVVVYDLPYGAHGRYINQILYYEADGMWFQPIDNGYLIVDQPSVQITVPIVRPSITFTATFGF